MSTGVGVGARAGRGAYVDHCEERAQLPDREWDRRCLDLGEAVEGLDQVRQALVCLVQLQRRQVSERLEVGETCAHPFQRGDRLASLALLEHAQLLRRHKVLHVGVRLGPLQLVDHRVEVEQQVPSHVVDRLRDILAWLARVPMVLRDHDDRERAARLDCLAYVPPGLPEAIEGSRASEDDEEADALPRSGRGELRCDGWHETQAGAVQGTRRRLGLVARWRRHRRQQHMQIATPSVSRVDDEEDGEGSDGEGQKHRQRDCDEDRVALVRNNVHEDLVEAGHRE